MLQMDPKNSIAGWYFTSREIDSALSDRVMINPSIDLTNACNLNCAYCYIEEKNSARKLRKPNELTYEEILLVIEDLRSAGARTINIVGAGEPTIDPHFELVVRSIAARGMRTVLFTNGIRLDDNPEMLELLHTNEVSVVLKYNSFSPETQDLLAGRKGYSSIRDRVLGQLLEAGFADHQPTRLGVDIIAFGGNVDEIPALHSWCRTRNVFPLAAEFIPAGRTEGGVFRGFGSLAGLHEEDRVKVIGALRPINSAERESLLARLSSIDRAFGIARPERFAYFGGSPCTQILGLYVDIEGNIWPCIARQRKSSATSHSAILGNTRAGDKPSEIWLKDTYVNDIRTGFSGGCPYKPLLAITRVG